MRGVLDWTGLAAVLQKLIMRFGTRKETIVGNLEVPTCYMVRIFMLPDRGEEFDRAICFDSTEQLTSEYIQELIMRAIAEVNELIDTL